MKPVDDFLHSTWFVLIVFVLGIGIGYIYADNDRIDLSNVRVVSK